MLQLLTDMLDKGCATYHYPVLRLLHEYMKLQDPDNIEIKKISNLVITATTRHIKVRVAASFNCCLKEPLPTRRSVLSVSLN